MALDDTPSVTDPVAGAVSRAQQPGLLERLGSGAADFYQSAKGALYQGVGSALHGVSQAGEAIDKYVPGAASLDTATGITPSVVSGYGDTWAKQGKEASANVSPEFAAATSKGLLDEGGLTPTNIANKVVTGVAGAIPGLALSAIPGVGEVAGPAVFAAQGAGDAAERGDNPLLGAAIGGTIGAIKKIPGVTELSDAVAAPLSRALGETVGRRVAQGVAEGTGFAGVSAAGQAAQNVVAGRPAGTGVPEAAGEGFVQGGAFGLAKGPHAPEPTINPNAGPISASLANIRNPVRAHVESAAQVGEPPLAQANAEAAQEQPEVQHVAEPQQDNAGNVMSYKGANGIEFPAAKNLSPKEREVEQRAANQVIGDPEKAVQDYRNLPGTDGGRIISTDEAREIFPDYNNGPEGRTANAFAVHEPSSYLAKEVWKQELERPVAPDKDPTVFFSAGGTGAGKTTAIQRIAGIKQQIDNADIVYDGNLQSFKSAQEKINDALQSGRKVSIAYINRDPVDAFTSGALPRAARESYGRTVPIDAHINTHTGAANTIYQLQDFYKDNPNVEIRVINNKTGETPVVGGVPDVAKVAAMDHNELRGQLLDSLVQERAAGKVPDRVWNYYGKDLENQIQSGRGGTQPQEGVAAQPEGVERQGGGGNGEQAQSIWQQIRDRLGTQPQPAFSKPDEVSGYHPSVHTLGHELASSSLGPALAHLENGGKLGLVHDPDADWAGKWENGRALLNSAKINQGEGLGVALHELGVHGTRLGDMLTSAGMTGFNRRLDAMLKEGSDGADIVRAADSRIPKDTPDDLRAEERIAYFIEEAANRADLAGKAQGAFSQIIARLKAALNDTALGRVLEKAGVKLKPEDFVALARAAVNKEGRASGAASYSKPAEKVGIAYGGDNVKQKDRIAQRLYDKPYAKLAEDERERVDEVHQTTPLDQKNAMFSKAKAKGGSNEQAEEGKRPNAPGAGGQSQVAASKGKGWSERPVHPQAVATDAVHYSTQAGLTKLLGRKYGSNHAGAEAARVFDGGIKNRVYFYPKDSPLANRGETMVGRAAKYEQRLNNIYDARKDTLDLRDKADAGEKRGKNWANAFEKAVVDAGFDGYRTDDMAVVLNSKKGVDVGETKYSKPKERESLYSAMAHSLETAKGAPKKGGEALKQWLDGAQRRGEFKGSERQWLGVDSWLDEHPNATREELAKYVDDHKVEIKPVKLGSTAKDIIRAHGFFDFDTASEAAHAFAKNPDAEAFSALSKDDRQTMRDEIGDNFTSFKDARDSETQYKQYTLPGGTNYREHLLKLYSHEGNDFQSSHFGDQNIIAHVRMNDRTTADNKKALHIEEIQSDWHQKGRKYGYNTVTNNKEVGREELDAAKAHYEEVTRSIKDAAMKHFIDRGLDPEHAKAVVDSIGHYETANVIGRLDEFSAAAARYQAADLGYKPPRTVRGAPDAPLKGTDEWAMLGFKHALREAVENGKDKVTWTTGDQQAERYDLAKQVNDVYAAKNRDGTFDVTVHGKHDEVLHEERSATPEKIESLLGKDLAKKISEQDKPNANYSGNDLKLGGEGMKGFYDKILPKAVDKYVKQWGGKVGESDLGGPMKYEVKTPHGETFHYPDRARAEAFVRASGEPATITEKADSSKVHSVEITPAMRESVKEGQPLFSKPKEEEKTEGSKNAAREASRVARGKEGVQATDRRSDAEVEQAARDTLAKDPGAGFRLADELAAHSRALSPEENVILSLHAVHLENERDRATDRVLEAVKSRSSGDQLRAQNDLLTVDGHMNTLDQASKNAGAVWSQSGRTRQREYTREGMLAQWSRYIQARGGTEHLPAGTLQRIKELTGRLADAQKRIQDLETQRQQQRKTKEADAGKVAQTRYTNLKGRAIELLKARADSARLAEAAKAASNAKFSKARADTELRSIIRMMAKELVAGGERDAQKLVDTIHGDLGQFGLERDHVRDIISGVAKGEPRTKSELQTQMQAIKRELRESARDPEARRNLVRQSQLRSQLADIQARIAAGNFTREKREAPKYNEDTFALQRQTNMAKRQLEKLADQAAMKSRAFPVRALDMLQRLKLFNILTSVSAFKKLPIAAAFRIATTPFEEAIGSAWRHIPGISQVAAQAPRHGQGLQVGAELAALKGALKSPAAMKDAISKGYDKLDDAFGSKSLHADEWSHWSGRLHLLMKEPAKQAEFERAYVLHSQFEYNKAIAAGMSPERAAEYMDKPSTKFMIGERAYANAMESIAQGNNKFVDAVRNFQRSIAQSSDLGFAASKLLDYVQPILKVPSNIVKEVTSYIPVGGFAKAALKLRQGVKDMTPEDADYVMKNLKKATMGTVLLTAGALMYKTGALHGLPEDEDRKNKKIEPGSGEFGGVKADHNFFHASQSTLLQMGASLARHYEGALKHKGTDWFHAALQSIGDVSKLYFVGDKHDYSALPGIDTVQRYKQAYENAQTYHKRGLDEILGNEARATLIPAFVQQEAAGNEHYNAGALQIDALADPHKGFRSPRNMLEDVELGIPGLREQVPKETKSPHYRYAK